MLNIDDSVRKMALRNNRVGEHVLKLLQLNAVDCQVFSNINQIQDEAGNLLTCHKPLNLTTAQIDEQIISGVEAQHEDALLQIQEGCEFLDKNKCTTNHPYCYWKPSVIGLYSKCTKKSTGRHKSCAVYHKNEQMCNADPMCIWKKDDVFFSIRNKPICQEKYPVDLDKHENSVLFEFVPRKNYIYRLYPASSIVNNELRGRIKSYRDFLGLYESGNRISPARQIDTLQNLISLDTTNDVSSYILLIKNAILKDQQAHTVEWLSPEVDLEIQQFLSFYDLYSQLRTMKQDISSIPSKYYEVIWDEKYAPNLFELSKNTDSIPYAIKLTLGDKTTYIRSSEIKDANLSLKGIEYVSSVNKTFQDDTGLYITIHFILKNGKLMKVNMEAIQNNTTEKSDIAKTSWTLASNNSVVVPYKDGECIRLWERNKLGYPAVISSLSSEEERLQAKECGYKWNNGIYAMPVSFNEPANEVAKFCNKIVMNSKECKSDDQCWSSLTHNGNKVCSTVRVGTNPYKCERRFPEIWTKKCYLRGGGGNIKKTKSARR